MANKPTPRRPRRAKGRRGELIEIKTRFRMKWNPGQGRIPRAR